MSTPRNTPRTHPLNASYLVVGLVFLGLAVSWALREAGVIDLGEARWVFPMTLVVAGLVGIVAMAAKGLSRREHGQDTDQPTSDYYDYEGDLR
jgi:hypothetical protein